MRIDTTQLAKRAGEKLPNQATILMSKWVETGMEHMVGFVLCVTGCPQPFVTWERSVDMSTTATGRPQQIDITYWGHYYNDLQSALDDYNKRVDDYLSNLAAAKTMERRGKEDGKAAASWLIDGNTPDVVVRLDDLIEGIDNGDPAILDDLPHPRVGGEFADDPTWEQICMEEIERYGDDGEEALFDIYTRAFHEGVEEAIREMRASYVA